jgi:hypothetical protein
VNTIINATFPQFSETGTWTVSVFLQDAVGNTRNINPADSGFPTDLVVVGLEDVTPPTLTAFSLTPTTIDTSAGPAVVTAHFSFTDNLSGVTLVETFLTSPLGTQSHFAIAPVSPPAISGSITADTEFPQFSETGTWTVASVILWDAVGNRRTYETADLSQLGFPTELVVEGQEEDVTPPTISVFATPKTLWPPNGKMVPVTISGTITDMGSGIDPSKTAYAVTDEYGLIQPSGNITLDASGNYSFTISLQASRKGNDIDGRQYTITVSAKDNDGNQGSKSTVVTVPHDQGH